MEAGGAPSPHKDPKVFHGPLKAKIPGRTDRMPIHVVTGSYVLPADIVSGLAEGNTDAGFEIIKKMIEDRKAQGGSVGLAGKYGIKGKYHEQKGTVPVIVAGGAAGRLKGGRHLSYPENTPMSNLLLSILHKAGIEQESVGDSTGPLTEL